MLLPCLRSSRQGGLRTRRRLRGNLIGRRYFRAVEHLVQIFPPRFCRHGALGPSGIELFTRGQDSNTCPVSGHATHEEPRVTSRCAALSTATHSFRSTTVDHVALVKSVYVIEGGSPPASLVC